MNSQIEKQAAVKLINEYANALNTADIISVRSFFTDDGIFMPNNFKTLTVDDLGVSGANYLRKVEFQINYQVNDVVINNEYAYVQATAQTKVNSSTLTPLQELTRDFFVLRKENNDWKIYRYIFNKSKT